MHHDYHEYIEDLRRSIPSRVHPAGRVWIEEWLDEMHNAADYGDMAAYAKLALRVQEKIDLELRWHQESLDSATRRPSADDTEDAAMLSVPPNGT